MRRRTRNFPTKVGWRTPKRAGVPDGGIRSTPTAAQFFYYLISRWGNALLMVDNRSRARVICARYDGGFRMISFHPGSFPSWRCRIKSCRIAPGFHAVIGVAIVRR